MQMDVHKTLYPFNTTNKMPHVTATVPKCASLAVMLLFHSCFFSHRIKLRGLLLSTVIVSLHFLLNCPRCLHSTVACGKTPTAVTFFKSEPLLPCDGYAIKTNIRTTAPKFCNLPLPAMERI